MLFFHISGKGQTKGAQFFFFFERSSLLKEERLMYVHDIAADVCVFAEPASSVLQRAVERNGHALNWIPADTIFSEETHSSTCADG